VLSRLRGARPTGRAARPSGGARAGSTAGNPPVGHRAALSAVLAAVAAAIVGLFLFRVPVDRSGDVITTPEARVAEWALSASEAVQANPEATPAEIVAEVDDWSPGGSQPYGRAFWPISAAVLLPVLGTGLGFRAVSRRASAKLVNRTMYVTLFGSLLVAQLMLVFLPAVISLAVAAFQVRKAEVLAASAAASDGASGDVIDVDEVPAEKASMDKLGVDVVDADEIIEVGEVPSDDASDRG